MLVKHGIYDMNEGFIAIKQTMPSGKQVTFKPAFTLMLTQHLHHSAFRPEVFIVHLNRSIPLAVGQCKYRIKPVRRGFIWPEDPEITFLLIQFDYIPQEASGDERITFAIVPGGLLQWFHSLENQVGADRVTDCHHLHAD